MGSEGRVPLPLNVAGLNPRFQQKGGRDFHFDSCRALEAAQEARETPNGHTTRIPICPIDLQCPEMPIFPPHSLGRASQLVEVALDPPASQSLVVGY